MSSGLWDDAEVIHAYTRAQAIADGVLIDVSTTAREAGLTWSVALTAAAWSEAVSWSQTNAVLQDEAGRLWDVLTMASWATKRGGERTLFQVLRIPNTPKATCPRNVTLQLIAGPGDNGEPVLTITCPNED